VARVPLVCSTTGQHKFLRVRNCAQIANCACPSPFHNIVGEEGGHEHALDRGAGSLDAPRGRAAVYDRHERLHQYDSEVEGNNQVQRVPALFGFLDHRQICVGRDHSADSRPVSGVISNQDTPNHAHASWCARAS
jgi:hypothetical protein